jgi:hypothetical protein
VLKTGGRFMGGAFRGRPWGGQGMKAVHLVVGTASSISGAMKSALRWRERISQVPSWSSKSSLTSLTATGVTAVLGGSPSSAKSSSVETAVARVGEAEITRSARGINAVDLGGSVERCLAEPKLGVGCEECRDFCAIRVVDLEPDGGNDRQQLGGEAIALRSASIPLIRRHRCCSL